MVDTHATTDFLAGLADRTLLRDRALIGGEWTAGDEGATFPVVNPATGETLAQTPRMGAAETRRAIGAAEAAYPAWRGVTAKVRAKILRTWADLMRENAGDLALLLTSEMGKPIGESLAEVEYAAAFFEWFGEEAKRVYGDTIPAPFPGRRIVVLKEPLGVTAGITPWNFPSAMVTRKAAPAIAAGNTMVLKPAEQTPLSALAIAELGQRAGLPPGVFNVVTGDGEDAPEIGGELTSNPTVRMLGFTGSTEVGKILMRQCADTVKKVALELGGNAPFIVFADADLDLAVEAMHSCKFRNSGQTCISANRVLVHASVFEEFTERLTDLARHLEVAPGVEDGAKIGPMIDDQGFAKVERHVADAVDRGGEIVTGGAPHGRGGLFFQPTVITGVTAQMDMSCEETFGPVVGLMPFEDEDAAVAAANDTPYGLAAYYFTQDVGRAWRVGEALEAGVVALNTGLISTETAPFGGFKESGIGREGSKYGLEEWLETKYLTFAGI